MELQRWLTCPKKALGAYPQVKGETRPEIEFKTISGRKREKMLRR